MTTGPSVRATLEATAGPVLFSDLAAHLRRNAVFFVGPELLLADAATAIAMDDAARVTSFLASGSLRRPTLEEQKAWEAAVGRTWIAIVVQPFVLVADPTD
jgi:hypothetical protein